MVLVEVAVGAFEESAKFPLIEGIVDVLQELARLRFTLVMLKISGVLKEMDRGRFPEVGAEVTVSFCPQLRFFWVLVELPVSLCDNPPVLLDSFGDGIVAGVPVLAFLLQKRTRLFGQ